MVPPIAYHGGKSKLAPTIVDMLPRDYTAYVEPYAGSLAVLLAMPEKDDVSEVVNDLSGDLTNFWKQLRDNGDEFIRRAVLTPNSDVEFSRRSCQCSDCVTCAFEFFVRAAQSRSGTGKHVGPYSRRLRNGVGERVNEWLRRVDRLPEAVTRLRRVHIMRREAIDVIATTDTPTTIYYIDPPYYPSTRSKPDAYAHEMDHFAHVRLLNQLARTQGRWLLSGYDCDLYCEYESKYGWKRDTIDVRDNTAAVSGGTVGIKSEIFWRNY